MWGTFPHSFEAVGSLSGSFSTLDKCNRSGEVTMSSKYTKSFKVPTNMASVLTDLTRELLRVST
jgi:hypothetical protein